MVAQVQAEYTLLYGGPDDSLVDDGLLEPPHGAFFVGYVDGVPVAMGGWRRRSDVPALGRQRVGRDQADVRRCRAPAGVATPEGCSRTWRRRRARPAPRLMVLETGTMQPEAIAMYEAAGYERIEDFGYYSWSPLSRCYGKLL